MTVRHIEVPSVSRANALIAEIDGEEGLPRAAEVTDHVGRGPHIDLAPAAAWVAAVVLTGERPPGDPPAGVTRTWDEPLQHPTDEARYSVQVTDAQMQNYLIGRQPAGFPGPIQAGHAVERGPEWFAPPEGDGEIDGLRVPSRL